MLKKSLTAVLAVLIVTLLALQASSLFVFPVPDSIRWFGDESWLMTESIATVETGTLHHPYALSSTLAEDKTLVFISLPWLRTVVYGIPAWIAFPQSNPVDMGRLTNAIFAFVLLVLTFLFVLRQAQHLNLALATALLLLSSRAFFFASHSARPDILVGLIVLAFGNLITKDSNSKDHRSRWFWVAFSALMLSIGLPIHLYFYLFAICAATFVMQKAYALKSAWTGVALGIVAALAVASLAQLVFTGGHPLAASEHQSEFSDVTRDIPFLKLFSLSAQLAVLSKHSHLLWHEGAVLFVLLPFLTFVLWKQRETIRSSSNSQLALLGVLCALLWYFVQRPHPAYLMHMMPIVLVAGMIALARIDIRWTYAAIAASVILTGLGISDALTAKSNGAKWSQSNEAVINTLSSKIDRSVGEKPLVMLEASAMKPLLTDTSIRLITTHFQFFPVREESIASTIDRNGVDYALIFNTARYGYDRNAIDPLIATLKAKGELVATESGDFFDIGKDYFDNESPSEKLDTLFLYKIMH